MPDDRDGLGDPDSKQGRQDVVLDRVSSLKVLEAVEHPAEVGVLVEEVGQEENGPDGLREEGQRQVAARQPLRVELEQEAETRSGENHSTLFITIKNISWKPLLGSGCMSSRPVLIRHSIYLLRT